MLRELALVWYLILVAPCFELSLRKEPREDDEIVQSTESGIVMARTLGVRSIGQRFCTNA